MSFKTWISSIRANRKESQEITNAGQTIGPKKPCGLQSLLAVPFALAFVGLLAAIQPAAADELNLTVLTNLINSFIGLITPITNLIIAIVPMWFVIIIVGFIMGLLAAILGMITKGMKFGK
jgi:hypothetical protein